MSIRRFNKEHLLYLIPLITSVVEWYVLNHNDIPPAYPTIPDSVERQLMFSVMNGASFTGIVYLLIGFPLDVLSLYLGVPATLTSTLWNFFTFEILFLGIFFSSKYFLKKYFNASGFLLYFTPTLASIPVPITWYTVSGVIYFFPGVYALTLALLDYSLDIGKRLTLKQALLRSMIVAIAVTLDFTDPRGIVFGILTFFIFSLYFLALKRGKRLLYLKEWTKVFFLGVVFFILLNFNTIAYTEFIKPYIPLVGVSVVYSQLYIALQHVQPFYTLSGIMYWLGANYYISRYHANLILGVISIAIGLIALLFRKPITIFLGIIILTVVAYNYVGATTLGYYLAQTPYVGDLVYLYPTYLPSYFFVASFYLLVSFTFFTVAKYLYKGRYVIVRVLKTLLVCSYCLLPFISFYSPIAHSIESNHAISPPQAVINSINMISRNDSGIVLVLGNYTLASFYSGLPSMLYPAYFGYMNFIWNGLSQAGNPARFLSYFGVQYVVILKPSIVGCFNLFVNNPNFTLIYNNSGVLVFKNDLYQPILIQRGVYIAFNFPEILEQVSELNSSFVIIPFYYVNNLQTILPYVKGFIGYNLSPIDLIPMLITNSSYVISASNVYLNQYYTKGWVHDSPYSMPDIMDAISEDNGVPLNLTLKIPDGKYYVFILPVGTTFNEEVSGNVKIYSGNTLSISLSNSVYNVNWVFAGKLNLVNHEIHVVSNNLGIVKIVLVPSSCYNNLFDKALSILKSREEISVVNNSINVEAGNYSPTAYGISVFANPWIEFLPYTHVVEVKNYVYESSYYFGTANVYIFTTYPSINLSYPSLLPELVINFILDLGIISYIVLRKRKL
ncbi:hypothetical protein [Saccharolobus islandicus]|uniref:Uncharacterized protein n=1 Tax=Saccharolobus islandicus (strain HVE10/4) TaxID=930943 RepID=F0NNE1_SACI0|nr:hypothetical protein [Sulfolobus islandicus]ADX81899.1 hypothetical protein SiH_0536 [Sulfolobus islandicus HVE10/4]